MKVKLLVFLFVICFCINDALAEELVIFSGRKEPLIKPVIELFEMTTGISVVLKTGKSAALGQQILQEMPNPSADIYIAKESGSLEYLHAQGAFEAYTSEKTERIPQKFKSRDGSWIGVSGRSRAVIYNKDLIDEKDVPRALDDLLIGMHKGKIAAVNAANESFIAWISALRIKLGDAYVKGFLEDLKGNDVVLISKSHTDIRKAVGRGEYPLGLINHYYYHLQRHENDTTLTNVGIVYLDQEEHQRGEIVNVSGAAIVKGAKNAELAKQFIDFLVSDEAQELFAEVNFEYPLVDQVPAHPEVLKALNCSQTSALKCLHVMDVNLDLLGEEMAASTEMLDEVSWY